jgi:hypothetical protein
MCEEKNTKRFKSFIVNIPGKAGGYWILDNRRDFTGIFTRLNLVLPGKNNVFCTPGKKPVR